jgi:hypothetical protein
VAAAAFTPGLVLELGQHALEEHRPLGGLAVARLRQRHVRDHQPFGAEPRVGVKHAVEAAQHQPGSHQQHERHRDLGDHEPVAHAVLAGADAAAAGLLERLVQLRGERAPGRDDPERQPGHDGERRGHPEHDDVDPHLLDARHARRQRRQERLQPEVAEQHAGDGAQQRQQHALGQQLAQHARAAGPEREPHGDLALPVGGAREQQVRDVRARDQQHEGDRAQQQHQRGAHVADHGLVQRLDRHALLGVRVRVLLGEPRGDRLDVGARLLHVDAGLQAAHHVDAGVVAAVVLAADLVLQSQQRREDLGVPPAGVHRLRHHPDHRERVAAQDQRLANHLRIPSEAPLPEAFAQERDAGRAGLLLLGPERAAEDRLLAERREHAGGDLPAVHALGLGRRAAGPGARAQDEVRAVEAHDRVEHLVLVAHVLQVRDREAHLGHLLRPLGEEDQALRLRVRERPQQDRVDYAEDGGVRTDPQRQRRHRDEREAGRLPQRARREADVAPELFHGSPR